MEFIRIFKNKRMVYFTVILLLFNVVFFVKDQYSNRYHLTEQRKLRQECTKRYQDWDLKQAAKDLKQRQKKAMDMLELADYEQMKKDAGDRLDEDMKTSIRKYESEHAELYREYRENKEKDFKERLQVETCVYEDLSNRYDHILKFQKKLKKIRENEKAMSQVSIFKNNRSTNRSIDKTANDYERLKDTVTELGNDDFFTSVFSYEKNIYFVFLFALIIVWQMLAERKKGLWVVVYATAKGRTRLALHRVGILLFSMAAFLFLDESFLFLTSGILYGPETNICRSIQSIPLFSGITIPMEEWQFLFVYFAVLFVVAAFTALFLWLVFVAVDNRVLAMAVVLLVYFAGYLFYSGLTDQSYLVIFKYLNFFYFLHADRMWSSYLNFRMGDWVFNRISVVFAVLVSGVIVCAVIGIVIHTHKHPCHKQSILARLFARIAERLRGVTDHFSVLFMELYKVLVIQKGALILIVLLYFCASSMDSYPLYYSPQQEFVNRFYEKYAGPLEKDALKYLKESERQAQEKTEEYENAVTAYKKGTLSETDREVAQMKYDAAEGLIQGSTLLRSRIQYLLKTQKELNQRMWVVNPMGYERLFGEKSYERQLQENLKILVAAVLMLSGIFAFERKKGTKEILCATPYGRNELLEKKVAAGVICIFLAFVCVKTASFVSLAKLFPFTGWAAPLKSLPSMAYNDWNCTIWEYFLLTTLLQLFVVLAFGLLIAAISAAFTAEMTITVGIVFLLPSFLDAFGVAIPGVFSIARFSTVVSWQSTTYGIGNYLIYWSLLLFVVVVASKGMQRFWVRKM